MSYLSTHAGKIAVASHETSRRMAPNLALATVLRLGQERDAVLSPAEALIRRRNRYAFKFHGMSWDELQRESVDHYEEQYG